MAISKEILDKIGEHMDRAERIEKEIVPLYQEMDRIGEEISEYLNAHNPCSCEVIWAWELRTRPEGEQLDEDTYHDENGRVVYLRAPTEDKLPTEIWVAAKYYPERVAEGTYQERQKKWEWLDKFLGDKLWFWLWLYMVVSRCLQYIKA